MPAKPKIEPLFIVGLPRSGSTLWSRIVDEDEGIFCFREMHFLSPWRKDFRYFQRHYVGDIANDDNLMKLVDSLMERDKTSCLKGNFWIQLAKVEPERLAGNIYDRLLPTDRSLGQVFTALLEEACAIRGYQRYMVKFPVYVSQLAQLRAWYPEAPIVHITRDPRAIAASKTNDPGGTGGLIARWPWMRYPLRIASEAFVIMQYNLAARIHEKYKNSANYQLFSYEDLMANPQEVIARLCGFAGLQWTDNMLQPKLGQPSSITGVRRGGIDAKGVAKWKEVLSSTEIKVITRMTQGGRARYNFDPDSHVVYQASGSSG